MILGKLLQPITSILNVIFLSSPASSSMGGSVVFLPRSFAVSNTGHAAQSPLGTETHPGGAIECGAGCERNRGSDKYIWEKRKSGLIRREMPRKRN